jgi:predicted O-methyltransferase YrrM
MSHSEFLEISQLKWGPVTYKIRGLRDYHNPSFVESHCLRMEQHEFPISVRQTEFEFLKKLIIDYDLKNGFELATAFGVSTVALGLGFKQTGGKLITMDSYVEEVNNTCHYESLEYQLHSDSDGWKSVNYLIEHFRLKDVVSPDIGWSPQDTGLVISRHTTSKLDFVFLDAGHFPEQVMRDLNGIKNFLCDEYVIALHDYYDSVFPNHVVNWIVENFGVEPKIALHAPKGDNLALIVKKPLSK